MTSWWDLNIWSILLLWLNFWTTSFPKVQPSPLELGAYPWRSRIIIVTFLGVWPQEVAHGPLRRHFLFPVDRPHVVHWVYVSRQSSVHANVLVVHHCSQSQILEYFHTTPPRLHTTVLLQTLVIKTISLFYFFSKINIYISYYF
jgi:hypothetical protein